MSPILTKDYPSTVQYVQISLEQFWTGIISFYALPKVLILQLCKVSSVSVHSLRSSCTYKKYGQTDGQSDS